MINKVLVADDSALSRKFIRRCLEFAGLRPQEWHEASNGSEALLLLQRQEIDLLITDMNMPVMDGLELLRAITELPELANLKKIVMTSVASAAWETELKHLGVLSIIPKPVTPVSIGKALSPLLAEGRPG